MRHSMMILAFSLALLASFVTNAGQLEKTDSHVVWIGLANGLEVEAIVAAELRALLRTHEVEPWILTRKILIDKTQIPHSHPVITIHTRHIGDEHELLSTFVHEQLHWLEDEPWLRDFQAAMAEYEKLFPAVPTSADGGARDKQSTYRHLLICDLELQALTTLVGDEVARDILNRATHYQWIYDTVLSDPRIREVSLRHGFNVAQGIPGR